MGPACGKSTGISLKKGDEWFHLARYFDSEYGRYGPEQLAGFLGLPVDEVFPISYDISLIAEGNEDVLKGQFHSEPLERLSRDERMSLLFDE